MTNAPRRRRARLTATIPAAVGLLALAAGWAGPPAAHAQGMAAMGGVVAHTADALGQVPPDALVVFRINRLDQTNAKVSTLLQQLGIVDLKPEAKDPLKLFEDQIGVPPAAVDGKRDLVLYMPNVAATGKEEDEEADAPPAVILLPVADYKAFVAALQGSKADGAITTGHFKDNPEDVSVAQWGDYAAISPKKDLLTAAKHGLTLTGSAATEMDQKDLCVLVNFPVLKKVLQPQLAKAKAETLKDAETAMGSKVDAGKKAAAKAALEQAFNVADSFLRDAEPTTIGLSVTKAGVSADMTVAFTPGSYLGDTFGHMRTTADPLLGGLPDEKYLFFGGSINDTKMAGKLFDDLLAPITPKLAGMGPSGAKIQSMLDLYKGLAATSEGGAVGLVVPTAALGQGSLVKYVTVVHGDAEKFKAAQEQWAELQSSLMADFGVKEMGAVKSTVTKSAKTVNGVAFDKVDMSVDPNANDGQAAQMDTMLKYVYGPDGANVLIGSVDAHTAISTVGVDDQLLGLVVDAAKANKDVLSAQVKAVDAELPKQRSAVAYIDLAQFFATGLSYAHANGFNVGVQLPANLPPVGVALGADAGATALKVDGFVPASLMQSLVQAGYQMFRSFNHGGGGGM